MPADDKVDEPTIWVWPGSVVPLPDTYIGSRPQEGARDLRRCELPGEFYLRELMELDLSSQQAIAEFRERWGDLGMLPKGTEIYRGFVAAFEAEHDYPDCAPADPLVRFRAVAKVVRDMTRIWLTLQGALSFEELAQCWESPSPAPQSGDDARDRVAMGLNVALKPFQVHVVIEPGGSEPGTDFAPLVSVVCLQLANDIIEKAHYTRCRNEQCGRLFSRQRGRAKAGQYRTVGVDFCSRSCALAQSQRDWRRRKRAARSQEKGSL